MTIRLIPLSRYFYRVDATILTSSFRGERETSNICSQTIFTCVKESFLHFYVVFVYPGNSCQFFFPCLLRECRGFCINLMSRRYWGSKRQRSTIVVVEGNGTYRKQRSTGTVSVQRRNSRSRQSSFEPGRSYQQWRERRTHTIHRCSCE